MRLYINVCKLVKEQDQKYEITRVLKIQMMYFLNRSKATHDKYSYRKPLNQQIKYKIIKNLKKNRGILTGLMIMNGHISFSIGSYPH